MFGTTGLSTLFGLCRQTTTFVFLGHPVRGCQWTGDGDGEDPHRHHRDAELLVVNLLLFGEVLQFFQILLCFLNQSCEVLTC